MPAIASDGSRACGARAQSHPASSTGRGVCSSSCACDRENPGEVAPRETVLTARADARRQAWAMRSVALLRTRVRSGERCVQGDRRHGGECLRDGTTRFRALRRLDECALVEPGHGATNAERDLRDPLARYERDGGGGVELLGGRARLGESPADRAIAKQAEWAAAINSSGLVLPFGASARDAQLTSSAPKAPLPASWIVPSPSINVPCQVVLIVRSVAIACGLQSGR